MEPWGIAPTQTDANGNFSIQLTSSNDCKMMAVDKERKRGGLIIVDPRHLPAHVECRLVPLVRVHGRFRVAATGKPSRSVGVFVRLPFREAVPLGHFRLGVCSSAKSRFEFWLPPGDYSFEATSHDPPHLELTDPHHITVPSGTREYDCGVFELGPAPRLTDEVAAAKKSSTWRNLRERYGEACPPWHVTDTRDLRNDARPSNFRGKWVLVYFWGPGCGPCIEHTLPKLRQFYEAHQSQRDRFELVSIYSDLDAKMRTMADFDREMKPVVKTIWGGRDLPFPVLLDNTSKSMENFGVEFFGAIVLIDPTGRLVPGDELTLAAILDEGDRIRSRAAGHEDASVGNRRK